MESFSTYYLAAMKLKRDAFINVVPGLLLLKPPDKNVTIQDDEAFEDRDRTNPYAAWTDTIAGEPTSMPAELAEWRVAPVVKTSKSPPFNRVVAGRSQICDIALPYPSISKVHAEFHVEEQRVTRLGDRRSKNGTFLNGRRLAVDEAAPVRAGDLLRFGSIELKLVDAGAFYDLLHSV